MRYDAGMEDRGLGRLRNAVGAIGALLVAASVLGAAWVMSHLLEIRAFGPDHVAPPIPASVYAVAPLCLGAFVAGVVAMVFGFLRNPRAMTTAGTAVGLLIASVFAWIYIRA